MQDVEIFITRFAFKQLDADNSGHVQFGEFWQNYGELVSHHADDPLSLPSPSYLHGLLHHCGKLPAVYDFQCLHIVVFVNTKSS